MSTSHTPIKKVPLKDEVLLEVLALTEVDLLLEGRWPAVSTSRNTCIASLAGPACAISPLAGRDLS